MRHAAGGRCLNSKHPVPESGLDSTRGSLMSRTGLIFVLACELRINTP